MTSRQRTLAGVALGFIIAFVVSLLTGQNFIQSIYSAIFIAVIVGVLVAVLSWAIEYAQKKGYPGWLGFVLVLMLNILGVFILIILPDRTYDR
ncbi:MAG: hypothetical protein ACNA8H_13015 [Anaerolineales bacterium]